MNGYNKNYFERYAQLLLSKVIDEKYIYLDSLESPDFQDNKNKLIGLEVTRAITSNEGKFTYFLNDSLGKKIKKPDLMERAQRMGLNPYIHQEDGFTAYSETEGLKDTKGMMKTVSDSIKEKLTKLNNNYETFKSNELFVFLNFTYELYDIRHIINFIDINDYKIKFDKIYMYNNINLYEYKFKTDRIREITLENVDLKELKTDAKMSPL